VTTGFAKHQLWLFQASVTYSNTKKMSFSLRLALRHRPYQLCVSLSVWCVCALLCWWFIVLVSDTHHTYRTFEVENEALYVRSRVAWQGQACNGTSFNRSMVVIDCTRVARTSQMNVHNQTLHHTVEAFSKTHGHWFCLWAVSSAQCYRNTHDLFTYVYTYRWTMVTLALVLHVCCTLVYACLWPFLAYQARHQHLDQHAYAFFASPVVNHTPVVTETHSPQFSPRLSPVSAATTAAIVDAPPPPPPSASTLTRRVVTTSVVDRPRLPPVALFDEAEVE
jgi:hypothetical protein